MDERDRPEHSAVMASSVEVGDVVTNLGTVTCLVEHGAFVAIYSQKQGWNLATGGPVMDTLFTVFHAADEVVLDVR